MPLIAQSEASMGLQHSARRWSAVLLVVHSRSRPSVGESAAFARKEKSGQPELRGHLRRLPRRVVTQRCAVSATFDGNELCYELTMTNIPKARGRPHPQGLPAWRARSCCGCRNPPPVLEALRGPVVRSSCLERFR